MTYRSAFILPSTICALANGLAAEIGIDPKGLLNTLSIPLVPVSGPDAAEPTHFACCGILTEPQRLALEAASGQFPGALWWRWEQLSGKLAASYNSTNLNASWGWNESLLAAGLKPKKHPLYGSTSSHLP